MGLPNQSTVLQVHLSRELFGWIRDSRQADGPKIPSRKSSKLGPSTVFLPREKDLTADLS